MSIGWYPVIDYDYETYKPEIKCEGKPKVAFICVHNSCRSQIAEALGKKLASDVFESYSAGTELKDHINPDAIRMMKKLYGIDMEKTQYNKLITDIPKPDVVIFHYPNPFVASWLLRYITDECKLIIYWHLDIVARSSFYAV